MVGYWRGFAVCFVYVLLVVNRNIIPTRKITHNVSVVAIPMTLDAIDGSACWADVPAPPVGVNLSYQQYGTFAGWGRAYRFRHRQAEFHRHGGNPRPSFLCGEMPILFGTDGIA